MDQREMVPHVVSTVLLGERVDRVRSQWYFPGRAPRGLRNNLPHVKLTQALGNLDEKDREPGVLADRGRAGPGEGDSRQYTRQAVSFCRVGLVLERCFQSI